uniref:PHD-type zinc finger plants domain-containing protein n=1 Tax=Leersia perrieri TaxID=77586 RepID=A0A0D9VJ41_9ORYZ
MASTVCSMCGDVGFPDKLFRCARCRRRFQHSYCTNYYGDGAPAEAGAGVCDWCISEASAFVGKKGASAAATPGAVRQLVEEANEESFRGKSKTAAGGGEQQQAMECGGRRVSKGAVRRYKLLKDVLC